MVTEIRGPADGLENSPNADRLVSKVLRTGYKLVLIILTVVFAHC